MSVLKQEQKEILDNYGKEFQNWINTDDGKQNTEFMKDTSRKGYPLAKMTEDEFVELYKKLWASNMWRNNDWYIKNKLIYHNGLENYQA